MASDVTHVILVVDDEPDVVDALRRTLRDPAWRVIGETSPQAALEVLAKERVDLVISDIDMPGTNGVELVNRVRAAWPDTVRFLLTGGASLGSALRAINEGEVHRYLLKPWDRAELRETVRAALARLTELRRTAAADGRAEARTRILDALEAEVPGITRVDRSGQAYVLDERALDARIDLREWFAQPAADRQTWMGTRRE